MPIRHLGAAKGANPAGALGMVRRDDSGPRIQWAAHHDRIAVRTECLLREKLNSRPPTDMLIMLGLIREAKLGIPQNSRWKTRLVERGFPDRSFDIEFWQEQGDEAIFAAAWEMVELAQGRPPRARRQSESSDRQQTILKPDWRRNALLNSCD